jgi:hypothetical protein
MGKTLIAGPWVGEFGWELFAWQAYIRALSQSYDRVVCLSRPASTDLYDDFVSDFVPFEPPEGLADAFFLHGFGLDLLMIKRCLEENGVDISSDASTFFFPRRIGMPPYTHYSESVKINDKVSIRPTYITYGKKTDVKGETYVIHARSRKLREEDNWSLANWNSLVERLADHGADLVSMGTEKEALHIEGTRDMRGAPLTQLFDILRNATAAFGPSSGPMHLASLCECPHVVWSKSGNYDRYTKNWNPLQTPVLFLDKFDWHPSSDYVFKKYADWRERL